MFFLCEQFLKLTFALKEKTHKVFQQSFWEQAEHPKPHYIQNLSICSSLFGVTAIDVVLWFCCCKACSSFPASVGYFTHISYFICGRVDAWCHTDKLRSLKSFPFSLYNMLLLLMRLSAGRLCPALVWKPETSTLILLLPQR